MSQTGLQRPRRGALGRRRFVGMGIGATLAVFGGNERRGAMPQDATPAAGPAASLASPTIPPAGGALVEPEVRTSQSGLLTTTLTARHEPTRVNGETVTTTVYEGSFPGPTLRLRGGDTMRIKLVNELDAITNLHTHGFHVSPLANGDNVFVHVMPGETFEYEYTLPTNHSPGLYWYHPHFHGDSRAQTNGGMAGMMIVEGDLDQLPGVAGVPERLLVLQATEFAADGTLVPPKVQRGDTITRYVNGQLNPTIAMRPGETQRWRICNAAADPFFNLKLDGHQLHQISADGNTLREVWARDEILMGPAERVEVLVRAGPPGIHALRTLAWGEGFQAQPEVVLATVVVAGEPVPPAPLPTTLLPFDDLRDVPIDRRREITFQQLPGPIFEISGKQFDEHRVDQTVKLNATEEWLIDNTSHDWHPFHIHVNDYQVVAIDGQPVAAHSYEDTTPVPPHGSITIRTRFLDYTGKFVYHCHILNHEDGGMMAVVEVRDEG